MRRDQLAFLVGGIAIGFLLGFGLFHMTVDRNTPVASRQSDHVHRSGAAPSVAQQGGAVDSAWAMERITVLKQRLERDPGDDDARLQLANIFQDIRMFPQAIPYYEKVIEGRPGNPDLLTDLGTCYRGIGNHDKALALFAEAQRIAPEHWQSLYNTVIVQLDLGSIENAEEAFGRLRLIPGASQHLDGLRRLMDQASRTEKGGEPPS